MATKILFKNEPTTNIQNIPNGTIFKSVNAYGEVIGRFMKVTSIDDEVFVVGLEDNDFYLYSDVENYPVTEILDFEIIQV